MLQGWMAVPGTCPERREGGQQLLDLLIEDFPTHHHRELRPSKEGG